MKITVQQALNRLIDGNELFYEEMVYLGDRYDRMFAHK